MYTLLMYTNIKRGDQQCRISPILAPPQNAYRGPPNGYLQKKVMSHFGIQWPSKKIS